MSFVTTSQSERQLFQSLTTESIDLHGYSVYYILRDRITKDQIFNEQIGPSYSNAFQITAYFTDIDSFDGDGNLLSKFGFEIRDECTLTISREKWNAVYAEQQYSEHPENRRPFEGDLIYLPISKSYFEIVHVEHEIPFYQLNHLPAYELKCRLFEYSDEEFDTDSGNQEDGFVDHISEVHAQQTNLIIAPRSDFILTPGYRVYQIIAENEQKTATTVVISGKVVSVSSNGTKVNLIDIQVNFSPLIAQNDRATYRSTFIPSTPERLETHLIMSPNDRPYPPGVEILSVEEGINDFAADNDDFQKEGAALIDRTSLNRFGNPS